MRPIRRRFLFASGAALLAAAASTLFVDAYEVPTGSMEPWLHGDRSTGDRVLVLRDSGIGKRLRRFDPAVFRSPDGAHCVKRAAGLPGEIFQVVEGDLFVNGRILRKDDRELSFTLVPTFDSTIEPFEGFWQWDPKVARRVGMELDLDAPPAGMQPNAGLAVTRFEQRDDYLDPYGRRVRGVLPVGDLALAVEGTPLGESGDFRIVLFEGGDRFEFRLDRTAGGTVARVDRFSGPSRPGQETRLASADAGPLRAGVRFRLEAMNVDDRLRLLVDGRDAFPPVDYERNTRLEPVDGSGALRTGVHFGGSGLRAKIHRVLLRRDLHYAPRGAHGVERPISLGAGEFFFLGDNSRESLDSRDWGPIPERDLLARTFLIYWPPRRIRWL